MIIKIPEKFYYEIATEDDDCNDYRKMVDADDTHFLVDIRLIDHLVELIKKSPDSDLQIACLGDDPLIIFHVASYDDDAWPHLQVLFPKAVEFREYDALAGCGELACCGTPARGFVIGVPGDQLIAFLRVCCKEDIEVSEFRID